MNAPICVPVCQKCLTGCYLADRKPRISSRATEYGKKNRKHLEWRPDIVVLVCGTEVVMPMTHLSYKGKFYCDKHGRYEKKLPKPRRRISYPEEPLFLHIRPRTVIRCGERKL